MADERNYSESYKKHTIKTSEQARELGRKGGIAAGVTRRRKANLRKAMQALLTSTGPTIEGVEVTYEEALVLAMVNEALTARSKNNVAAFNAIVQILKSEAEEMERKARIGKLKAETDEIRRRSEAETGSTGAQVVIIDDIPDDRDEGNTETAVFDALGESRRDEDGTGPDQAD